MPVYINGVGAISPQKTWADDGILLDNPIDHEGILLRCVEPDYNAHIDPKYLRRMSRILKMGVTACLLALKDAAVAVPDGIITGTGYGCLEDSGTFLKKMIEQKEQALNPTPFIQSTHNTIGSQIALLLGCRGYNQTYTQEAFSFENSLTDALMQSVENPEHVNLTGGVDEVTEYSLDIQKRFIIFRDESASSLDLFKSASPGTLAGEGAFYFALSGRKSSASKAVISSVETIFKPSKGELIQSINHFMDSNGIRKNKIDLILVGKCGDAEKDRITDDVCKTTFGQSPIGVFKHLCGEYSTASAFALWLGVSIIRGQHVPTVVTGSQLVGPARSILIYNPYFENYHSLILLRSC